MINLEDNDPSTQRIIGCAIEVHRTLGPGLPINFNVPRLIDEVKRFPDPAFRAGIKTPSSQSIRVVCTLSGALG